MTTSTNTARTRRQSAKAPEVARAVAVSDTRDVARTKRKAAKPPGGAQPSTVPSDAASGRAKPKPEQPLVETGPSMRPSATTAGRAKRKPAMPLVEAAPAISAVDAPAADRIERSVVDLPPVLMPSSGATRLRLLDRIEREVAKPQSDMGPAHAPMIATAAPAAAATSTRTPGGTLRRIRRGLAAAPHEAGEVIGGIETRLFDCPACARPLANGTMRCPGCGVRMVMGVRLKRAGAVLALGVAIGVLFGGAAMTAAFGLSLTQSSAGAAVQPTAAPIAATAAPPAGTVAPPALPGVPPVAIAALSGTAVVNGRIAVDASTLVTTLARKSAPTIEIARALRSLAADAALGVDLTGRLRPWTEAAPTMSVLDDFYQSMATTAHLALRAPLSDDRSYRTAAAEMMTVLRSLAAVDAASRTLAASVGLELPPVTLTTTTNTP